MMCESKNRLEAKVIHASMKRASGAVDKPVHHSAEHLASETPCTMWGLVSRL